MSQKELISIIITVYNIKGYLPRCLEKIAAQSCRNLEIILVDDGSTDGSGAICDEFVKNDNRARVIHQSNQGSWAARNAGLKVVKGNYIMFVDGDDYLHIDAVRILYQSLQQNVHCDMAFCDFIETTQFSENVNTKLFKTRLSILSKDFLIRKLIFPPKKQPDVYIYVWNKLFRKDIIAKVLFNKYSRSEDFDFNLRAFMKMRNAVWVHQSLYFYVQRPSSLVHQADSLYYHYQCILQILMNNFRDMPDKRYKGLLLKKLYRQMVMMKGIALKFDAEELFYQQCNECIKTTRKAYLISPYISFIEKCVMLLLFYCPNLAKLLMKATHNY